MDPQAVRGYPDSFTGGIFEAVSFGIAESRLGNHKRMCYSYRQLRTFLEFPNFNCRFCKELQGFLVENTQQKCHSVVGDSRGSNPFLVGRCRDAHRYGWDVVRVLQPEVLFDL